MRLFRTAIAAVAAVACGFVFAAGAVPDKALHSGSSKLQAGLAQVAQQTRLQPISLAATDMKQSFPLMHFSVGGSGKNAVAMVSLNLVAQRDTAALSAVLQSLGATNISSYGRMLGARVPVTALETLAASPELLLARPVMRATRRGAFLTQGDFTMRTRFIKPASSGVTPGLDGGPTGAGIKVGVLSDSFACNTATTINPGNNLPFNQTAAQDLAGAEFAPVTVLKDLGDVPPTPPATSSCPDGLDEGRAMIQLVADVAPGSTQGFYTAFESEADFANGILALRNNFGADIVADDVGYFDEPYFQDGIIAQAAQAVYDDGGMYFSSAGNSARLSYEAPFQATTATIASIDPNPSVYHNFAVSPTVNTGNNFRLARGSELTLAFEWDQPYASATVGGAGSQSDLDVFLLNASNQVVAFSADSNVGADPFEILDYTNPGNTANFRVVINVFSGPVPTRIKWISIGGQTPATNGAAIGYNTNSGTATGHPAAAGVMAEGAAPYYNTVECGTSQTTMESFSSWGGTPILFAPNGTRLAAPVIRQKPDVTAPDGGRTSFFLSVFNASATARPIVDCQDPDDGLANNFFGTSAAAPHAAGVAALLKQAAPQATNAQIYAAMRNTAADITVGGTNVGAAPGFDFQSGFGYLRADAAYNVLVDTTPDAFSFTDVTAAQASTSYLSNSVTVSGVTAPVPLVLTSAEATAQYSVNGAGFKYYNTNNGQPTVKLGDTVQLRIRSSATGGSAVSAALSLGGVSASWTVTTTAGNGTPNPLVFASKTGVASAVLVSSGAAKVQGISASTGISIGGDASAMYHINGGPYTNAPGTVSAGDIVQMRLTSGALLNDVRTATLTVGGQASVWNVTTGTDTTPVAFRFAPVANQPRNAVISSSAVAITGISVPVPISVGGDPSATYSINGAAPTNAAGMLNPGDSVSVQLTTSPMVATTSSATLTVGGTSAAWNAKTTPK